MSKISPLFVLVLVYSLVFVNDNLHSKQKKQIELELIREIRFDDKYGRIRQIAVLSEDDIERIKREEKIKDKEIFPVRAVNLEEKDDIILYDAKGNISRINKKGSPSGSTFISDNGEYFAVGETDVLDREGKLKWSIEKPKDPKDKRNIIILSNDGCAVVTKMRAWGELKSYFRDLSFYDNKGRLLKHIDVDIKELPAVFRDFRQMFQFSDDGKMFVAWINGELVAYDKKGDELWKHRFEGERIDRLKISPNGKYIVVSCAIRVPGWVGSKNIIYLFDSTGKLIVSCEVLPGEIKLTFSPDSKYLGIADYQNAYLIDIKDGKLLWEYVAGELFRTGSIAVSKNGEYVFLTGTYRISRGVFERNIYIFDYHGNVILKKEIGDYVVTESKLLNKEYLILYCLNAVLLYRIKE